MLSKKTQCFLLFLLFLSFFCTGTAAANKDPVLDYPMQVYISGAMVTIVLNHDLSHDSENYFSVQYFDVKGPTAPDYNYITPKENIIQFNAEEVGEYHVHYYGYFPNSEFRGAYLTFNVTDLDKIDDTHSKRVVYPSRSYFTTSCNNPGYHTSYYEDLFEDDLYPDIKNVLADNNVIYNFYGNHLTSLGWYNNESESVLLTGGKVLGSGYKITISDFKPQIHVNISKPLDFEYNYLYICPEHYNVLQIGSEPTDIGECLCDVEWNVFINGESKSGDEYSLKTFDEKYPNYMSDKKTDEEKERGSSLDENNKRNFPHYVSLNDMNVLTSDLISSRDVSFGIYPVISIPDSEIGILNQNEIENERGKENSEGDLTIDFDTSKTIHLKEALISIDFIRKTQIIRITEPSVVGNKIDVSIKTDMTPPIEPLLSNMVFPEIFLEVLTGAELMIENLNHQVLKDVDSNLMTDETQIHSVLDIDFNEKSEEINHVLKSSGSVAVLEFEVPATDSSGNPIQKEDLKVWHIYESDTGEKKVEELRVIKIVQKTFEASNYYVLTVETNSFSPFAIVSKEFESAPLPPSYIPSKKMSDSPETKPAVDEKPEPTNPTNITKNIPDIIENVRGHLSLFSILVILTSGLFLWNYIRRNIE